MKILRFHIIGCLAIAALVIAGCAGKAGVVPAASAGTAQSARGTAPLSFAFEIPKKTTTTASARVPQYVSPATQGLSIDITGPTDYSAVAALTVASGNCTSTLASTICTLTVPGLSAGSYTASISAYDNVSCTPTCVIPGGANLLSDTQGVPFTITLGQANSITMTLGGDAVGLIVTPNTNYRMSGSNGAFNIYGNDPVKFSVLPVDADDNFIIGPGAPQSTVTLASGGQATVSAVGASAPNEWALSSTYEPSDPGVPSNTSITVTATPVPGSSAATVTSTVALALYQPWVYVSDDSSDTVTAFDEDGNPKATGGFSTALSGGPSGLTYDPHNGWIYVTQYSGDVAAFDREGDFETDFSSGISASNEAAFDPNNDWVYVLGYNATGGAFDEQGDPQTLAGGFPGMSGPHQVAFDTQTNQFYVANNGSGAPASVSVYDETGASVTTSGVFSNFSGSVSGVSYDPLHGWLWFVGSEGQLGAYDGNGNVTVPLTNLADSSAAFNDAFDPYSGSIYVTNRGNKTVTVYDESGNELVLPTPISVPGDLQGVVVVR